MPLNSVRACTALYRTRIYPDGEVVISRQKETAVSPLSGQPRKPYEEVRSLVRLNHWRANQKAIDDFVHGRSVLGLSKVLNSHTKLKRKRTGRISHYGTRLVRNAALLLERKVDKRHLSFLTLTLPASLANGEASKYSEAMRQFNQWLSRRLSREGLPDYRVGCLEVQESRLQTLCQFALHTHLVFQGRHPYGSWVISPSEFTEAWEKCLENAYGVTLPASDRGASTNVQRVKKSVASYLGKYLSKGSGLSQGFLEENAAFLPRQWHTVSRPMLALYKAAVRLVTGPVASLFLDVLPDALGSLISWGRHVHYLGDSGREVWCAWRGYLTAHGSRWLQSQINQNALVN